LHQSPSTNRQNLLTLINEHNLASAIHQYVPAGNHRFTHHRKPKDPESTIPCLNKSLIDLCVTDKKLINRITKIEIRETFADSDHRAITVEVATNQNHYTETPPPANTRKRPRIKTLPKPGKQRGEYIGNKVKELKPIQNLPKDISQQAPSTMQEDTGNYLTS